MNKHYLLLFIVLSLFNISSFSEAFALEKRKDTYYFIKSDGDSEFSDEEKDAEAQHIYQQCQRNILQRAYFNCECVAGAFRVTRDTDENLRPQDAILTELFNNDAKGCIDKPMIAGETYKFCSHHAKIMRSRSKNNEEYCSCVANSVADKFADDPRLRTHHIENLRTDAMVSCHKKFK